MQILRFFFAGQNDYSAIIGHLGAMRIAYATPQNNMRQQPVFSKRCETGNERFAILDNGIKISRL